MTPEQKPFFAGTYFPKNSKYNMPGLIIAALAKAYKVLDDKIYFEYAKKAVNFIYANLINENGRLLARYRDDESLHKAYLDDYAFL